MSQPQFLICAPETSALMVFGTTFEHRCSKCHQRVMISPSGQERMKAGPVTILCLKCFDPVPDAQMELSAGTPEAAAQEFSTMQPNTWRNRN